MLIKWFACKKNTQIFIGNEKALLYVLNCSLSQQEALLVSFDFESILKSCISYFGEENICWDEHQIILVNHLFKTKSIMNVFPFYLEIDDEEKGFDEYLMRFHQKWCLFHHETFFAWKSPSLKV